MKVKVVDSEVKSVSIIFEDMEGKEEDIEECFEVGDENLNTGRRVKEIVIQRVIE